MQTALRKRMDYSDRIGTVKALHVERIRAHCKDRGAAGGRGRRRRRAGRLSRGGERGWFGGRVRVREAGKGGVAFGAAGKRGERGIAGGERGRRIGAGNGGGNGDGGGVGGEAGEEAVGADVEHSGVGAESLAELSGA